MTVPRAGTKLEARAMKAARANVKANDWVAVFGISRRDVRGPERGPKRRRRVGRRSGRRGR